MTTFSRAHKTLPTRTLAGLVLAIFFDTVLQLVWKSAAVELPSGGTFWCLVNGVFQNPLFLLVLLLMTLQFFNWMMVLCNADLSYAQPVTAVSYVLVLGASALFFQEPVDAVQVSGVALVLIGVWFISRTDSVTPPKTSEGAAR